MTQLTRIEGMPTGQGSWYLGWIGDLKYNVSVPGEMTINVVVSPIIDDKKELLRRGNIDWSQSRIVPVSIAAIPYLEIGSTWRNGRMVSNHKTYNKQISANIFNYKCYFTTAGELWKEREGFDRNRSTLTRYLLDSPVYVVPTIVQGEPIDYYFPCSEIFRFFYGVSSPFVRLLFESATSSSNDPMRAFYKSIEEKQVIDISINDVITTAVIELTKHAYDADAPTIAEFALSIFAEMEIHDCFKRLSTQASQGKATYLQIRPPFNKTTQLKLNCRPLNFKENKSYLVEKIISYRHPFLFDRLEFGRENDAQQAENNPDYLKPYGKDFTTKQIPPLEHKDKEKQLKTSIGSNPKYSKTMLECQGNRCENLHELEIVKEDKKTQEFKRNEQQKVSEDPNLEDLSANKANDKNSTAGNAEFQQEEAEKAIISLHHTHNVLSRLAEIDDSIKVSYISCRIDNNQTFTLPDGLLVSNVPKILTPKRKQLKKWCTDEEGKFRRVLAARIQVYSSNIYMLEVERLTKNDNLATVLMTSTVNITNELDGVTLENILSKLGHNGSPPSWPDDKKLETVDTYKIKHNLSEEKLDQSVYYWHEKITGILYEHAQALPKLIEQSKTDIKAEDTITLPPVEAYSQDRSREESDFHY